MTAALEFRRPDRVPVILNNTFATSRLIGKTVREVLTDADTFAESLLAGYRYYGYDGIRVTADVSVEAGTMGCKVRYQEDDVPSVVSHIITDPDDLSALKMPNPLTDGRMKVCVDAVGKIARAVGDEAYVMGSLSGPCNVASQLMGVADFMMALMDESEGALRLLDFCLEEVFNYGCALVKAGAHGIVMGEATCSVSMMGPKLYKKYILPRHTKLIREFNRAGITHTDFHICGELDAILPEVSSTGVAALDVDTPVDMERARGLLGKKTAFIGNVDTGVLCFGSPADVTKACEKALKARDGLGLVLSAGCTMSRDTPAENTLALVQAAKTFGNYD
jgi:uroporphyrinogen decarboxylase